MKVALLQSPRKTLSAALTDTPAPWPCWQADLQRYGGWAALLREQSLWALGWHRLGCAIERLDAAWLRRPLLTLWWLLFRFVELATGISLPLGVRIGPGLRIWHFGGIFVLPGTTLGARCTLRQGVTLGNRRPGDSPPTLGDDVELGAYAQVLGPVHIGDGARIGALSVVLHDVPAGWTAVGAPARTISPSPADGACASPT